MCLLVNIFFSIVIALLLAIISFGVVYRRLSGKCYSKNRLDGRTVIITGASAGIGQATAEDLARRGGRIIFACRNVVKAENVAKNIIEKTGNSAIVVMQLDTSDMKSVRNFAREFKRKEKKLDILINNAGAIIPGREISPQGYELTYATNHLGHFLLTNLLLDMIKDSKNGRIVNVSSCVYSYFPLDLDDLNYEKKTYDKWSSYCQSKLCNILFTNELARKLKGTGITCNSMHPGAVSTEIMNTKKQYLNMLLTLGFTIIGKTAKQGAETIIYLAVADDVSDMSGEYFVDCKVAKTTKDCKNRSLARTLWNISEEQTELSELSPNKYD